MSWQATSQSLLALAILGMTGCAENSLGTPHPTDAFDFPIGVTVDPSGDTLWVTSGNFDFAYHGGAVLGIDIATQEFIPGAAIEIGSLPGPFVLRQDDQQATHGYVLSREHNALYHATITRDEDGPGLECVDGVRVGQGIIRCPEELAIEDAPNSAEPAKEDLVVGVDPFGALVRPARHHGEADLLLTGAMVDGNIASFTLDEEGHPSLIGNLGLDSGLFAFAENPVTGRIYTTSKFANVFRVLTVQFPDGENDTSLHPSLQVRGSIVVPETGLTDHARGLAINNAGTRLFAAHRAPAALVITDISENTEGEVQGRVIAKVPVGRRPSALSYVPARPELGVPELVYVSCLDDNRIDIVDVEHGVVIGEIATGHGPFWMDTVITETISRLYVTHFYDHSVGVIELDPISPFFHSLIAEIR